MQFTTLQSGPLSGGRELRCLDGRDGAPAAVAVTAAPFKADDVLRPILINQSPAGCRRAETDCHWRVERRDVSMLTDR